MQDKTLADLEKGYENRINTGFPAFTRFLKVELRESNPCPKTNSLFFYYHSLLFNIPSAARERHSDGFSSFIIRPYTQSFVYVVSHIVDARVLKCGCLKSDSCH